MDLRLFLPVLFFCGLVMPLFANSVDSLTLINADTDLPIDAYDPIEEGATLNLATLPTTNLSVRANTTPAVVGSVRFGLDGKANFHTESGAPYALDGDSEGNYSAWTPEVGPHTITATAYDQARAGGNAGTPLVRNFTVVNEPLAAPNHGLTKVGADAEGPVPASTPLVVSTGPPGGLVTGELRKWHRVTVTFDGPATSEEATTNPFRDFRLNVTFTNGSETRVVPGYFAADGDAGETRETAGGKWRVHFLPDAEGVWNYVASFRTGTDIAASTDPGAGVKTSFDGTTGEFVVGPTDKTGRDFRAQGQLRYVGERYLRFAETGKYFLKAGVDSPENFLGYFEFDGTQDNGGSSSDLDRKGPIPGTAFSYHGDGLHHFEPHLQDWKDGDPLWQGTKGRGIIGALNYLAGKGMNSVYFLTMNVNGDGGDVYPWTSYETRDRYDTSKLAQWEVVFSHMQALGLMLHVITQETENDQLLDGGSLGVQRKIYYRELVARFGHHPALVWNLGEENTNTDSQRKAFCDFLRALDPYDHPIVIHTYPGAKNAVFSPLLGFANLDGPSLQNGDLDETHATTIRWIDRSAAAGHPWFVCLDENGPAKTGVKPDADDAAHDEIRKTELWGNLMAGGAGCEWYFGYSYPNSDLDCEDWRSRDLMWDQTRIAVDFFQAHLPFAEMAHADALTDATDDYCLARSGDTYAIYLPAGGTTQLDLTGVSGDFSVRWFDPRSGGSLQSGSVEFVSGGAWVAMGNPPTDAGKDWVVLVRPAK